MSVINLLSSSLGVRNDIPNQKLAWEIAETQNKEAIDELVESLLFNMDKKIKSDCIKVLYETGYKKPELISPFLQVFIDLLDNKNNRLIWGAMIAIDSIADIEPAKVYSNLAKIMQAVDKGSVITKDVGVEILAKLSKTPEYEKDCFPLLMEQFKDCPAKQLAQYAEKSIQAINAANKEEFIEVLNSRVPDLEKDSQRKRMDKVMKKVVNT